MSVESHLNEDVAPGREPEQSAVPVDVEEVGRSNQRITVVMNARTVDAEKRDGVKCLLAAVRSGGLRQGNK